MSEYTFALDKLHITYKNQLNFCLKLKLMCFSKSE